MHKKQRLKARHMNQVLSKMPQIGGGDGVAWM
jgi:hypothetical protein